MNKDLKTNIVIVTPGVVASIYLIYTAFNNADSYSIMRILFFYLGMMGARSAIKILLNTKHQRSVSKGV